jgi:predicted secreted protein
MNTKIIFLSALFAFAGGCAVNADRDESDSTDETEDELKGPITETGNNKTFNVTEGDDVVLKLPANLTTGYDWVVTVTDRSFGYPTKSFKVDSSAIGSGGVRTFTWKTRAPFSLVGLHHVELQYKRSWEGTAIKKFAFNVRVLEHKVWPGTASKLVAKTGGGFVRPGPEGSTCGRGSATYTLDLATRKLVAEECTGATETSPLSMVKTTKTLTTAQLAKVDEAMRTVKISKSDICGADKPFMTLTVTAAGATKTFHDEFYSCMGGDKVFVTNIGAPFTVFRDLTD